MALKAKSLELTGARRNRYRREVRDMQKELKEIRWHIDQVGLELNQCHEKRNLMREQMDEKIQWIKDGPAEHYKQKGSREEALADVRRAFRLRIEPIDQQIEVAEKRMAKLQAKDEPLDRKIRDRQRWLDKH